MTKGADRAPLRRWPARHPRLTDAALAVGLWLLLASFSLIAVVAPPEGTSATDIAGIAVLSSVMTLSLALRRSHPPLMLGLVTGAHLAQLVVTEDYLPANVTAPMAAYAVARWSSSRTWRRAGLTIAVVSGPLGMLAWPNDMPTTAGLVISSVMVSAIPCLAWLWGDLNRRRHEVLARLQEQNDALRRDRDQQARIAAQDERTRIAREMHDVVAHSLAVVVVQADGAAYAAEHADGWAREQAIGALRTIGDTSREALAETRRLVGVLRAEDGGEGYAPTDALADLPEVVARLRDSGVAVDLQAPPDLTGVPRDVGLAALRVVQESLTNVLKHAGPGARAQVRVALDDGLQVVVEDDGRGGAAPDDGDGHGLVGMRERAGAVGGTLQAGPRGGGGYRVSAHLPLRRAQRTDDVADEASEHGTDDGTEHTTEHVTEDVRQDEGSQR